MPQRSKVSGQAALTLCESMLLAMNDGKVLPEAIIVGILVHAAKSLERVVPDAELQAGRSAAAALINAIINGRNSVRHP